MMNRKNLALLVAVTWLLVCTFLLTMPGSAIPKENWLDKIWADKWVHIGLFAIMVFLWCRLFLRKDGKSAQLKKIFQWIMWLAILYGIGMEFVQKYLVPNRSFDVWDIVADSVGAIAGYLFSRRYIKK